MTIPTRGELIGRAARMPTTHECHPVPADVADFALAEIRRAVAEELEALRDSLSAKWELSARILIDARLAALREPTKAGEFAGIPIMADPSVKPGTIEARAGNDTRLAALRASQSEAAPRPEGEMAKAKETPDAT